MQFINNMRGIAILLILATHSISAIEVLSFPGRFSDYLIGNGTMLFMFLSGYLFAATEKNFSYLPYLRNKFLVVVLPYTILSAPAVMLYVLGFKSEHLWVDMDWYAGLNPVFRYLFMLVTGAALGPLWFVPMVILYFLCAPIFVWLTRSRTLLIVAFLLALVAAVVVGRPVSNSNTFQSFVFFVPSYLLGMLAFNFRDRLKAAGSISLALGGAYVLVYAALYFFYYKQNPSIEASSNMVLYLPIIIVLVMVCSKFLDQKQIVLDMFARLSFFIFFVHGYFVGVARPLLVKLDLGGPFSNPIFECLIILAVFVSVTLLCVLSYICLKFITGKRSRYLIGG